MRKIAEMVIVSHSTNGSSFDYKRECHSVVGRGFVPYGKPYVNGNILFREFVKYEYIPIEDADPEEWEEDVMEEQMVPEDPWETHDFFEDIGND